MSLQRGGVLTGVVQDEEGNPVPDAEVQFHGPGIDTGERANVSFHPRLATVKTDGGGRFRTGQIPSSLSNMNLMSYTVEHPEYVRERDGEAFRRSKCGSTSTGERPWNSWVKDTWALRLAGVSWRSTTNSHCESMPPAMNRPKRIYAPFKRAPFRERNGGNFERPIESNQSRQIQAKF